MADKVKWSSLPLVHRAVYVTRALADQVKDSVISRDKRLSAKVFPRTVRAGNTEVEVYVLVARGPRKEA